MARAMAARRRASGGRKVKHTHLNEKEREQLLHRVSLGEPLHAAMRALGWDIKRYERTLTAHPKMEREMRAARRIYAHAKVAQADRIAMSSFDDEGNLTSVPLKEEAQVRRIAVEHCHWEAERASPDVFGPKVDIGTHDASTMSWAELAEAEQSGDD